MRPLELVLTLACAACCMRLAGAARLSPSWIHGIQALLVILLLAQIALEGWRWQILPLYAAALTIGLTPYWFGLGTSALFWSATGSLALLAAAIMSCLVLPFVAQPPPAGLYAVGVTTIAVKSHRQAAVQPGELSATPLVSLYYPAAASNWRSRLNDAARQRVAARLKGVAIVPAESDGALAQAPAQLPIVIYFDGWPETRIQNLTLILELASRGYAVATVKYPARSQVASYEQLVAQLSRPGVDYSSDAGFERSVQLDDARARVHARDAVAVLDALSALSNEPGNRFTHRLDVQHAGALGFSFGGAVAAQASRLDPRFKAVINLDGRHWADALEYGVECPYMFIGEELIMPTAADLSSPDAATRYEAMLDQTDYTQLAKHLRARGGIQITIAGAAHMNFSDVALRSPLRRLSAGGRIEARRAQEIIQTYVIEFFSRYLRSTHPPALNSPLPQVPEVRLQSWAAPAKG